MTDVRAAPCSLDMDLTRFFGVCFWVAACAPPLGSEGGECFASGAVDTDNNLFRFDPNNCYAATLETVLTGPGYSAIAYVPSGG